MRGNARTPVLDALKRCLGGGGEGRGVLGNEPVLPRGAGKVEPRVGGAGFRSEEDGRR